MLTKYQMGIRYLKNRESLKCQRGAVVKFPLGRRARYQCLCLFSVRAAFGADERANHGQERVFIRNDVYVRYL